MSSHNSIGPGPVLITGANGQLGFELARSLSGLAPIVAIRREEMPLEDADAIRRVVGELKPSLIVNAAAYTAVDRAETEVEQATAANVDAPRILAECANAVGAGLIHYSTDYVFDGARPLVESDLGYSESDQTSPLSVYARSKRDGEVAVAETTSRHLVFRSSWVYGARGRNFLLTMMRLAEQRDSISVVDDQHGAPTWSRTIATLTAHVIAQCAVAKDPQAWWAEKAGIYHMTAGGITTWARFAEAIFHMALDDEDRPAVKRISSAEYPTPVKRPFNSRLSNEKLVQAFGLVPPNWEDALKLCLEEARLGVA